MSVLFVNGFCDQFIARSSSICLKGLRKLKNSNYFQVFKKVKKTLLGFCLASDQDIDVSKPTHDNMVTTASLFTFQLDKFA
jgi:hypothetical protein